MPVVVMRVMGFRVGIGGALGGDAADSGHGSARLHQRKDPGDQAREQAENDGGIRPDGSPETSANLSSGHDRDHVGNSWKRCCENVDSNASAEADLPNPPPHDNRFPDGPPIDATSVRTVPVARPRARGERTSAEAAGPGGRRFHTVIPFSRLIPRTTERNTPPVVSPTPIRSCWSR